MLLNVWDAWWIAMIRIQAEEQRAQFVIAQAADAGWKMDRSELWRGWARLTAPKRIAQPTKDIGGQMHRFADWMAGRWGDLGNLVKRSG